MDDAAAGDIIYARGGLYDTDNTMMGYAPGNSWWLFIHLRDNYYDNNIEIANGEEGNPITIRNYPGETPVLNGSNGVNISVQKSYWIISGFELVGGMIDFPTCPAIDCSHDVVINNNDIHDLTIDGGGNPGLIRITRGDDHDFDGDGQHDMGHYNIFIYNNKLHRLFSTDSPLNTWDDKEGALDSQHFGAITVLSGDYYEGPGIGATGYIEAVGNEMYEVPMILFFKNPMGAADRTYLVRDNILHDSNSLGTMVSSHLTFENNLAYNVRSGFGIGWDLDPQSDEEALMTGTYITIRNNTFIDMRSLEYVNEIGGPTTTQESIKHTINHNIFVGLADDTSVYDDDSYSYIAKGYRLPDSVDDADSYLHRINSDNNCFVSPLLKEDLGFVNRIYSVGANFERDIYSYEDAKTVFGYDANSTFITPGEYPGCAGSTAEDVLDCLVYELFTDPDSSDFSPKPGSSIPAGYGYEEN